MWLCGVFWGVESLWRGDRVAGAGELVEQNLRMCSSASSPEADETSFSAASFHESLLTLKKAQIYEPLSNRPRSPGPETTFFVVCELPCMTTSQYVMT